MARIAIDDDEARAADDGPALWGDRLRGLLFVIGLRAGIRLQAMQEPAGAFGMSGRGEDRPLVVLHNGQPVADIVGMIGAGLRRQTEIGGEEGTAEFGDELLGGIAFVTPALATEFAIEAGRMTSPVTVMPISA